MFHFRVDALDGMLLFGRYGDVSVVFGEDFDDAIGQSWDVWNCSISFWIWSWCFIDGVWLFINGCDDFVG